MLILQKNRAICRSQNETRDKMSLWAAATSYFLGVILKFWDVSVCFKTLEMIWDGKGMFQKCSENVQKMVRDVQRCSEMFWDVLRCFGMLLGWGFHKSSLNPNNNNNNKRNSVSTSCSHCSILKTIKPADWLRCAVYCCKLFPKPFHYFLTDSRLIQKSWGFFKLSVMILHYQGWF